MNESPLLDNQAKAILHKSISLIRQTFVVELEARSVYPSLSVTPEQEQITASAVQQFNAHLDRLSTQIDGNDTEGFDSTVKALHELNSSIPSISIV